MSLSSSLSSAGRELVQQAPKEISGRVQETAREVTKKFSCQSPGGKENEDPLSNKSCLDLNEHIKK